MFVVAAGLFVPQSLFGVSLTVTGNFPTGVATQSYSGKATASGGSSPYTYNQSNLPKGLTINHSTGAITGTPTAISALTFTITATDANGLTGTIVITLSIPS